MEKITSRSNPVCIHVKKLGKSKRYRDEQGQFLCDGIKLLEEAVDCSAEIGIVLTSIDLTCKMPSGVAVYHVHESLIDSLSPLKNAQGVLFTCRVIKTSDADYCQGTHVMLDCIQDPGNVGTIIRSAFAFGIDTVIQTGGSADIYNPKTVRATMGAIFKQRIVNKSISELHELKKSGARFVGASNDADSVDIKNIDLRNTIIILGNEGQGISKELTELCEEMVKISLSPGCESLNVAAAASIIMYLGRGD